MHVNDQSALVSLITDVHAYYRQTVSEFVLKVWVQACQPFELEQVSKAMTSHITDAENGKFCPKVSDLVRVLSGTTTDRSAIAWGKTLGAMSAVGAYSDVVFDDAGIHAAIEDCGGWVKVCRGELAELSYLQHRFCTSYKAYVGRGTFEYQRRLVGDRSPDADFQRRGLPLPQPATVGDPAKAKLVYQGGSVAAKTNITFGVELGAHLSVVKMLEAA